jgi:hypothetical protein
MAASPRAAAADGKRISKKPHITETPITWANWYRHVNWLNVFFIIGVPLMGFAAAYSYPLQRATAVFAVIYYFNTGLGITAGASTNIGAIGDENADSRQATIVSGRIPHTERQPLSRSIWRLLVSALSRARFGGGPGGTALITGIRTQKRTLIPCAKASGIPISAGW